MSLADFRQNASILALKGGLSETVPTRTSQSVDISSFATMFSAVAGAHRFSAVVVLPRVILLTPRVLQAEWRDRIELEARWHGQVDLEALWRDLVELEGRWHDKAELQASWNDFFVLNGRY